MSQAPRLLTIEAAAAYCGVTVSTYRAWISEARVPGPVPGTRRYDLRAIDRALDSASGLADSEAPDAETAYDEWKRASATETHSHDPQAA